MTIEELQKKASKLGLKQDDIAGFDKKALVHFIQIHEGNFPCFGRATSGYCDRGDCAFRKDCLSQDF